MAGRITGFLREYVAVFSIIITVIGLFLLFMGITWYWVKSLIQSPTSPFYFIYTMKDWNAYTLAAGLIVFGIGAYYIYSFLKKRKFVLDELKSDKRSEILKMRAKLESTVKHLPSKYQRMLTEKEDELNIK
jgi:ABC-type xylose transport system permease subunit